MGWPNNYAEYTYDSNGNVVGLNNLGNLVKSPYDKMAKLGAKPIGFNFYSAVYGILIGESSGATIRSELLAYVISCNANIIRIALPCFSSGQYLTLVHNTASVPSTVSTATYRNTYISAIDTVFNECAALGIKIHVCNSWGPNYLPAAFSVPETTLDAYSSTTTQTAVYMRSEAEWFITNYGNHSAFGLYSIGNEYQWSHTDPLYNTPEQFGSFFGFIADAIHAINPSILVTTDLGFNFPLAWNNARHSMDTLASKYKTIFAGLDAYCFHIYSSELGMGRCVGDNATYANTSSFTSGGYEGVLSMMEGIKSIADAEGKPLIIGEFGIDTATEPDAANLKKHRFFKAIAEYSDYALLWNLQDSVIAAASGQSTWYIRNGTTRGNTFAELVTMFNLSKPNQKQLAGVTKSLKNKIKPRVCIKSDGSATGIVSIASSLGLSTITSQSVMFWLRLDVALGSGEAILDFRKADTFGGFYVLGEASATTSIYVDFRTGAGSHANTSGQFPNLVVGEWNHIAFVNDTVSVLHPITVWLNGQYWKTVSTSGTLAAIPDATPIEMLGTAGNGTICSMQDITLCESVTPEDIWAHMRGELLPQALIHVRGYANGIKNLVNTPSNPITIGAGIITSVE